MAEIKLKKKNYEAIIKDMSIELDMAKILLGEWLKEYGKEAFTGLVKETDMFLRSKGE